MKQGQAGTIDESYGQQGTANIPAEPPHEPDVVSLQVLPSAMDDDGAMVFFGFNPVSDSEYGLLTRVLADGRWDSATGHVKIDQTGNPPLPDQSRYFFALLATTTGDGRKTYYGGARPSYFNQKGHTLAYLGISRFDEHFQPVKSFGENGDVLPHPGPPWEAWTQGGPNKPDTLKYDLEYALVHSAGYLRTVFPYYLDDNDDAVYESWLAVLDPETGELLEVLGEHRDRAMLPLTDSNGASVQPLRTCFLDDGSLFLLALRQDDRVILRRYNAQGLPIKEFGDRGEKDLFSYRSTFVLGMDYRNGRLVLTRAREEQTVEPTTVFAFTDDGSYDPTFNDGQPIVISKDDKGLALGDLVIDEQDRILLGGAHLTATNVGQMNIFRLTKGGVLDATFGNGGIFEAGPDFRTANKLFLREDGLRILTLFPPSGFSPLLERVLKLHV